MGGSSGFNDDDNLGALKIDLLHLKEIRDDRHLFEPIAARPVDRSLGLVATWPTTEDDFFRETGIQPDQFFILNHLPATSQEDLRYFSRSRLGASEEKKINCLTRHTDKNKQKNLGALEVSYQEIFEAAKRLLVPRMSVTGNTYIWQANVTGDSIRLTDGAIEVRDPSNPDRVSMKFNNAVTGLPRVLTHAGWQVDMQSVGSMHGVYVLEEGPVRR